MHGALGGNFRSNLHYNILIDVSCSGNFGNSIITSIVSCAHGVRVVGWKLICCIIKIYEAESTGLEFILLCERYTCSCTHYRGLESTIKSQMSVEHMASGW